MNGFLIRNVTGNVAWVFPDLFEGKGGYRAVRASEYVAMPNYLRADIQNITAAQWNDIMATLTPVSGTPGV